MMHKIKPSGIVAICVAGSVSAAWFLLAPQPAALEQARPFEARPKNPALIDAIRRGQLSTVRQLLDRGASPEAVIGANDSEGQTALEVAADTGNVPMVRLLLDRGAEINAADGWGGTAIVGASSAGFPEVVRLLIGRGADVNADDDGATSLGYAERRLADATDPGERRRYQEVVRILRAAGARASVGWFW
jgi:uncharacterized protein